ncbi:hypothetical protein C3L23_02485 [Nautilia sp. PV-1]|uniref:helix-turn-helix domain-containing protein n=1 Tax=Nautilia sp. PV-1 TaxID=2579250 RepID=UPI000FDAF17C|nr:hypothetical protein [Nautilia sp. PV-1]AZV46176.1 hypothetical protein C3L23_02485 [Nautilia sp. PV-1]
MNAKDFFEQYSIEVINKRTRISPISLRFIKNKEFEKIPRVKFLGFVRIIEKEFDVDLSELIEEYNQATNHTPTQTSDKKETELKEPKKHNTLLLFILALILFSLGAYLLYKTYNSKSGSDTINKTAYMPNNEENLSSENNITTQKTQENNISKQAAKAEKTTKTQIQHSQQTAIPKTVKIFPNEKVWFKAVNLDNNKTVEYLTSNPKTLIGPNWYIKFGHGNITIDYGDKTITPQTKKIVRLLLKNGKVEYLKYPNRYEK